MIKFFRHIRYQLMETGKTSPNDSVGRAGRYFKYAIGEIILVVIGILIALQINNWNEDRKLKVNERATLSYALETLRADSSSIKSMIRHSNDILSVHKNLIAFSKNELSKQDIGNLDLLRASEPQVMITKKNNSSLANNISDEKLKRLILNYFLRIEWLEFTITNNNTIIEDLVRPFMGQKKLLNYGNQLEYTRDVSDLVDDDKFYEEFHNEELKQILFESGIKLRIMISNAERTLGDNILLIQAIEEYLSKK